MLTSLSQTISLNTTYKNFSKRDLPQTGIAVFGNIKNTLKKTRNLQSPVPATTQLDPDYTNNTPFASFMKIAAAEFPWTRWPIKLPWPIPNFRSLKQIGMFSNISNISPTYLTIRFLLSYTFVVAITFRIPSLFFYPHKRHMLSLQASLLIILTKSTLPQYFHQSLKKYLQCYHYASISIKSFLLSRQTYFQILGLVSVLMVLYILQN